MPLASKFKAIIDLVSGIRPELERIESKDNRDQMKARHGLDGVYPSMFGELSAVITVRSINVEAANLAIGAVERLERIEAIFLDLDIDLGDESLKALELLASERRYRHEQGSLTEKINSTVADILDQERERERDDAQHFIEKQGFVFDYDADTWIRESETITLTFSSPTNQATSYGWTLERGGVAVDAGKSGDFWRLLTCISPVAQEVKA